MQNEQISPTPETRPIPGEVVFELRQKFIAEKVQEHQTLTARIQNEIEWLESASDHDIITYTLQRQLTPATSPLSPSQPQAQPIPQEEPAPNPASDFAFEDDDTMHIPFDEGDIDYSYPLNDNNEEEEDFDQPTPETEGTSEGPLIIPLSPGEMIGFNVSHINDIPAPGIIGKLVFKDAAKNPIGLEHYPLFVVNQNALPYSKEGWQLSSERDEYLERHQNIVGILNQEQLEDAPVDESLKKGIDITPELTQTEDMIGYIVMRSTENDQIIPEFTQHTLPQMITEQGKAEAIARFSRHENIVAISVPDEANVITGKHGNKLSVTVPKELLIDEPDLRATLNYAIQSMTKHEQEQIDNLNIPASRRAQLTTTSPLHIELLQNKDEDTTLSSDMLQHPKLNNRLASRHSTIPSDIELSDDDQAG